MVTQHRALGERSVTLLAARRSNTKLQLSRQNQLLKTPTTLSRLRTTWKSDQCDAENYGSRSSGRQQLLQASFCLPLCAYPTKSTSLGLGHRYYQRLFRKMRPTFTICRADEPRGTLFVVGPTGWGKIGNTTAAVRAVIKVFSAKNRMRWKVTFLNVLCRYYVAPWRRFGFCVFFAAIVGCAIQPWEESTALATPWKQRGRASQNWQDLIKSRFG